MNILKTMRKQYVLNALASFDSLLTAAFFLNCTVDDLKQFCLDNNIEFKNDY